MRRRLVAFTSVHLGKLGDEAACPQGFLVEHKPRFNLVSLGLEQAALLGCSSQFEVGGSIREMYRAEGDSRC